MTKSEIKHIVKQSIEQAIAICETQTALADKAGVTQGAISKYLRGDALPKGETAKNLSVAVAGILKPADFAPHIFDQ
ncbi:MAG: helix-turn-helix domain-containing protein [Methylobacter sp.]